MYDSKVSAKEWERRCLVSRLQSLRRRSEAARRAARAAEFRARLVPWIAVLAFVLVLGLAGGLERGYFG